MMRKSKLAATEDRCWSQCQLVGGRWAHLSLPLTVSLISTWEKATDGVRRFSLQSQRCFFSMSGSLFLSHLRATCQGSTGTRASPVPPPGSNAYRERSPLCLFQLQILCYLPMDVRTNYSLALKWRNFFVQTNHALSQELRATPAFKIRLHGCSSLFDESESESERCHIGRFLHTDENLCYPQGALWVVHADWRWFDKECCMCGKGQWVTSKTQSTEVHHRMARWPLCPSVCEESTHEASKETQRAH